jgi:hypothetical protein
MRGAATVEPAATSPESERARPAMPETTDPAATTPVSGCGKLQDANALEPAATVPANPAPGRSLAAALDPPAAAPANCAIGAIVPKRLDPASTVAEIGIGASSGGALVAEPPEEIPFKACVKRPRAKRPTRLATASLTDHDSVAELDPSAETEATAVCVRVLLSALISAASVRAIPSVLVGLIPVVSLQAPPVWLAPSLAPIVPRLFVSSARP